MKVYLLRIENYDYTAPIGIYSSLDKAKTKGLSFPHKGEWCLDPDGDWYLDLRRYGYRETLLIDEHTLDAADDS